MPQFSEQSPQFQEAHAAVVRRHPRSDQAELSMSSTTEFHPLGPLGHRKCHLADSCDLSSIYTLCSAAKKNEPLSSIGASIISTFRKVSRHRNYYWCSSPPWWQKRAVYHPKIGASSLYYRLTPLISVQQFPENPKLSLLLMCTYGYLSRCIYILNINNYIDWYSQFCSHQNIDIPILPTKIDRYSRCPHSIPQNSPILSHRSLRTTDPFRSAKNRSPREDRSTSNEIAPESPGGLPATSKAQRITWRISVVSWLIVLVPSYTWCVCIYII